MLKIFKVFFFLVYFFIIEIPNMRRARRYEKAGDEASAEAIVSREVPRWAQALLRAAGVSAHVSGLENIPKGPVVFICNHQGDFDVPVILASLPRPAGIIAKIEMKRIPLMAQWMDLMGCLYVDRRHGRKAGSVILSAIHQLRHGKSVIIFPEGTRSRGDEMSAFKYGGFKMAIEAAVPIVPISLSGSYKVFERNFFAIKSGFVTMHVLKPIDLTGLSEEEKHHIHEHVRELLMEDRAHLSEV